VADSSIYAVIAVSLAVIFGAIGAIQLIGPKFARTAYRRWDYSQRVRLLTGILDIAAAFMLALPALRGWGIALAGILTFGSVIVFLSHRQYRYAVAAIGLMAALVPAAVAVPRPSPVQFIDQAHVATEGSQTLAAANSAEPSALIE
jgi:branched-subunit amino acid ABC-type transport system permease component